MAVFFQSNNCIKYGQYTLDEEAYSGRTAPELKPKGPVLKWYNTKMSYEDKYRFGLLTYEEFILWQQELASQGSGVSSAVHFWEGDITARSNVSADEYSTFLVSNNIDVSNNTTLDIDALLQTVPQALVEATPAPDNDEPVIASEVSNDVNLQSVLRSVTRDIHGETFLSQAEIDALFASAAK